MTPRNLLRERRFKYVHHVAYRPQLFDLGRDPEEFVDVAPDPRYADALSRMRERVLAMLDLIEVDARAKRRQAALLARHGGRAAALARGDLLYTPAPGTQAEID